MFTCDCGQETLLLKYRHGKKTCCHCENNNLSGNFERRMLLETKIYEKDIIQPYNKDGTKNQTYADVYGTKIYEQNNKRKAK